MIAITLLAYITDSLLGEFKIKHPVVFMGEYIQWFERHYYRDSIVRGGILIGSLLIITLIITYSITFILSFAPYYIAITILSLIASTGIAGNMLYHSVKGVLSSENPKRDLSMLVSRDTENLSDSDIYKACVETYSENLCDGVIAPLFYLLLFNLEGLFLYKAISTLDSMVGYKSTRYWRFGKVSARLDDVMNYIPARLTVVIISLITMNYKSIQAAIQYGGLHESPNAGYPISAMAGGLGIALGGDTSYRGELKSKPYFNDGRKIISRADVMKMLGYRYRIDILIIGTLTVLWLHRLV